MENRWLVFALKLFFITFLFLLAVNNARANVTILGSRVIYPASAKTVDVQLKNNGDIPYVIQAWFDNGDANSQPEQSSQTPFIVTPPVFRIQPKTGQIARIIFNGSLPPPQDRESVFWFNTLQIPPANLKNENNQNAMMVMLRNRLKIFYRPVSVGNPNNILKNISLKIVHDNHKGLGIEINNPQPWHASLLDISFKVANQDLHSDADMIPPFSKKTFWFSADKKRLQGVNIVSVAAVNDQGARISENYKVEIN